MSAVKNIIIGLLVLVGLSMVGFLIVEVILGLKIDRWSELTIALVKR